MEESGWSILNRGVEGDPQGEWTFTGGRANTVIDYALGNEDTWENVERVEVGERVDSDHHPVVVWLRGRGRGWSREEKWWWEKGRRKRELDRGEKKEVYAKLCEEGRDGEGVEEVWRELRERIKGSGEEVVGGGIEEKEWGMV